MHVLERPMPNCRAAHVADHHALFRRVQLDLGTHACGCAADAGAAGPTRTRTTTPQLLALYFQYGRYLLIASSRPGSQPANLQGIWNDRLRPPWDSKWTTNINTEMNYWPAELTNLSECHEPLFDLLDDLAADRAQRGPGALWRARLGAFITTPTCGAARRRSTHSNHGIWPTGGAWLCQHLWWRYAFTGDVDFSARARLSHPARGTLCSLWTRWSRTRRRAG